jgi:hypothetical protein
VVKWLACHCGSVEVVTWLTCHCGNVEVVKWLTCHCGSVEVVKWLDETSLVFMLQVVLVLEIL